MSKNLFLVELGTEELPPTQLTTISTDFVNGLKNALEKANLAYDKIVRFATPRRIAAIVEGLDDQTSSKLIEKKGPSKQACFDEQGNLTKAAQGWLRANGITFEQAQFLETEQGSWLYYSFEQPGVSAKELLFDIVKQAVNNIQIAKGMRWGSNEFSFIRPVHTFTMLLNDQVIDGELFGIKADNLIYGHRFLGEKSFRLEHANQYESKLEKLGHVIANPLRRSQIIYDNATSLAASKSGYLNITDDLLDEIASLVEWPNVLVANYDKAFLEVPKEALVHTMEGDQRYFPMYVDKGLNSLLSHFVFVSNIDPQDPSLIISGNEKVITPRLTDAKFFYEQDLKTPLEKLLPRLETIVFQKQLGTVYDKVQRIVQLAEFLSPLVNSEVELAKRAALLSKCDLMTNMVFEFTDTQGIMGMYYAQKGGEHPEVAQALFEQYLPRSAGDVLPQTKTGAIISIADKLDTLVGIFGINQAPKAAKDPFALRRASIAILRILTESKFNLDLEVLLDKAIEVYGDKLTVEKDKLKADCLAFINGRIQALYQEQGYSLDCLQAVQNLNVNNPLDFFLRLTAIENFKKNPACADLAAANKRVKNFLSKAEVSADSKIDESLLQTIEEQQLFTTLNSLEEVVAHASEQKDYEEILKQLATTREVVNAFFDKVIVLADDLAIRANRLALLNKLNRLFTLVADVSALNN